MLAFSTTTDVISKSLEPLVEFCKQRENKTVELLLYDYEERKTIEELHQSTIVILQLSPFVDTLVASDSLPLDPPDDDNLEDIIGSFISVKIMRKFHTQRRNCTFSVKAVIENG